VTALRLRPIALCLVTTALLVACSSGPGSGGTLEGTKWVLRSFEQAGELVLVPEAEYADAEFGASRVRGFGGCNDFTAAYRAGGRTLLISQTASTLAACAEGSMTFEQTYLAMLDSSRFYSARRDTLTIYDEIGSTVLVFDAAPRNALLGHWRVDSFATGPGAVSAVLPATELEVVFGIGSVGGSAGCNSFSGTYGTNGNVVRVGQLATTRKACPQDVMDQETAFLEALQGIALIDPRADSVNLTDLDGALAVALIRPGAAGAEASPSLGSPAPSASSSPSEIPSGTPAPTESSTPAPTRTPAPTTAPSAPAPSTAPSTAPSPPPTAARCDLITTAGGTVASIAYPGSWYTVTEPADLACRYFDPAPIEVPSDPATLTTTVQASVTDTTFADAVTAATDPATWTVTQQSDLTVDGLAATQVIATANSDAAGIPIGMSRVAYIVDVGSAGSISIWTAGDPADDAFAQQAALLGLMTEFSEFTAPT
jgi:heat shock protein HslJ